MNRKEVRDFFLEQLIKSENNGAKICIKREKRFAGALIPYFCVFGVEKDTFLEYCREIYRGDEEDGHVSTFDNKKKLVNEGCIKRIVQIRNGEKIEMNITDEELSFFVYVESTPEFAFSNQIKIQSGDVCDFEIKTSYHWMKGMSLSLNRK